MGRTTFVGNIRSHGGSHRDTSSPGVVLLSMLISADPTQTDATLDASRCRIGDSSTTGSLAILPKGAIPVSMFTLGGGTGGTTPTLAIGSSVDDNGLMTTVDADTAGGITGANGALLLIATGLTADTQITAVGGPTGTDATGGTWSGVLTYFVLDDGKRI